MPTVTLNLIGLDEGGVRDSNGNLRLVCLIEGGGKLALWGSKNSRKNIDRIMDVGMPCEVKCDCIPPKPWGVEYGHTYWVPEGNQLEVISK